MTLCLCPSGVQKQRNKGISYNYMTTKTFKGLSSWSSMPEAMFAKWPLVLVLANKAQNVSCFEQPKRNRGKQLHSRFVLFAQCIYSQLIQRDLNKSLTICVICEITSFAYLFKTSENQHFIDRQWDKRNINCFVKGEWRQTLLFHLLF